MILLSSYQTTTVLPDPEWSNSEALASEINIRRSINGLKYSYIKQKSRRKLIFNFNLTEPKAQELRSFLHSYLDSEIKLIDHNDIIWIGIITNNPFEFSSTLPDYRNIQLEFEGIKQ
jgi:hypothetical protein